jgi:membrane protein implicated in regulation of membrane protease activity
MDGLVVVFWYWWVLAVVLLVVELLAPGFFFLWMSASGLLTGLLLWLVPTLSLDWQIFIFSSLSIIAIIAWKKFFKNAASATDQPLLNKRGQQYVGRVFNLYEAIENGQGKIKVDDTIWKVHGEDCPLGSKVKVVASRGTVFDVEQVG